MASYTNVNDSSMRACTCTRRAAGVTGQRRHQPRALAGHRALLERRQLGIRKDLRRSGFHQRAEIRARPCGAYSQTWRPSGVATWLPGIITELSPVKRASSQCGLRRNRVGGMFA